ncbi:MAG: dienelactone hydrolase [Bdellovibrionaceae bacterium]|nr:dienelactone hydrolase [Pseudobdellovibrionaceae bacterium]|tara:strand:- start:52880 stop:53611 length:732 start_codon:yes stop_codon:yes gene_type:complete
MKKIIFLFIVSLFAFNAGHAKNIEYKSGDKIYEGFFLKKSESAPLIFIHHDWDGLTAYEKKRAKMLYDMGYSVFALDLFGKGIRPTEVKDRKQHTGELYKDRQKMRAIMKAAYNKAKELNLNVSNAVSIGYCFGGASALEQARSGENLKGYATFHGGLSTPDGQDYSKTKGKIIIFHGTADEAISMEVFAELAEELEKAKVKNEMITYSQAPHAFTVFDGGRYHKEADEKSWARLQGFLKETL